MNPTAPSAAKKKASSILHMMKGNLESASTLTVKKRDGRETAFDEERIRSAIEKAFRSEYPHMEDDILSAQIEQDIQAVLQSVLVRVLQGVSEGVDVSVERIQDAVEEELMRHGHFAVARHFILYRSDRMKARTLREEIAEEETPSDAAMHYIDEHGEKCALKPDILKKEVESCCEGLTNCSSDDICEEVITMLYDGVTVQEMNKALLFAARARIEREPDYTYVAARLLLHSVYREALGTHLGEDVAHAHEHSFHSYIQHGVNVGRLTPKLLEFDMTKIAAALKPERDELFQYLGIQTLYDRYLLHDEGRRIETPQYFWMRVAMGLSIQEGAQKEERAIEFYNVLSKLLFVSSTPTLFNAGTLHAQLSSCYLLTVDDDLEDIFKLVADDARLSKWAGGLGNDWTNVRATGSHIKGTNGTSQGIIPFLKVANDTAVAVNQGGKRKGAMCGYLETWHLDIEDFLDLRKNTGDERRRTHDMNTANWIPDLFMKRVATEGQWTLFDPSEVPDLHDLYGKAFDVRYEEYEKMAAEGEIKLFKQIPAVDLWRKMISRLFETGHPWMTFKDPSNIRSPQDHAGVVHSSNLCTEILLNTSADETAVCNLGSVNLVRHIKDGQINQELLKSTIATAMRMLDNVIDINYYPTKEAQNSNMRHRPVGLGMMGFQDALYVLNINYASQEAVDFADTAMEQIAYFAISASIDLAAERGAYESYEGSKWSKGILPIDTVSVLEEERGEHISVDKSSTMDWDSIRTRLKEHGIRNSNTMAIAPTATIANISGVSQSIEPTYKHLFSKSNLSGDFTCVNTYLIDDLKERGLWDAEMLDDLKYFDGVLTEIERIPDDLREKYRTSFEIEPGWLIECASRRQKWIDMGQSLNLYMAEPSGKKLHDMYMLAWERGLKTTYYLRSLGATQVEKSTQDINRRGLQPRWMKSKSASSNISVERADAPADKPVTDAPKACSILDPDCEACQ